MRKAISPTSEQAELMKHGGIHFPFLRNKITARVQKAYRKMAKCQRYRNRMN